MLATLIRVTGQVDLAQDAAQDAMVWALETWPRDGVPGNRTVLGLLALLLLTDARRAARVDRGGRPVLLADQDRSRWDAEALKEGVELVGRALRRTRTTPTRTWSRRPSRRATRWPRPTPRPTGTR